MGYKYFDAAVLRLTTLVKLEITGDDLVDIEVHDSGHRRFFRISHVQDCCERVRIYDTVGSKDSLIGKELEVAEEETLRDEDPPDVKIESSYRESWSWSIFTFGNGNDRFVIRWLGESNGYYGETASLDEI